MSGGYVVPMLPDLLRLRPLLVERPWGGRRLSELGRELPPAVPVGESWEVADLPAEGDIPERCTLIAEGELAGMRLLDVLREYGAEFLGSAGLGPDGRFPLLVKLLDAREHLSVQVHPPEDVAGTDPTIRAKTESWYVLQAVEGARLWLDVKTDVPDADLRQRMNSPEVVEMLGEVAVRPGDFHHIPAGRVHALGAGIMVFEIQTPSDTTFRIYDWTAEYHRTSREVHVDLALESIVRGDPQAVSIAASHAAGSRTLVRTAHYWLREHRVADGLVMLDPRPELRVIMVAEGTIHVGGDYVAAGQLVLIPAASPALGPVEAADGSVVLEAGLA